MNREHDDDMELEVEESGRGETEQYATVTDDVEAREADESEAARLRRMRENLEKAEGDEIEEG